MKKLICLPVLTCLIALANVVPVLAAEDIFKNVCAPGDTSTLCAEAGKNSTVKDNGVFGVNGIFNKGANILLILTGIAAVAMIIVGGAQYVLSSGDPQSINKAKDMIIFAIVGLIVALAAKGIIAFVINRL